MYILWLQYNVVGKGSFDSQTIRVMQLRFYSFYIPYPLHLHLALVAPSPPPPPPPPKKKRKKKKKESILILENTSLLRMTSSHSPLTHPYTAWTLPITA